MFKSFFNNTNQKQKQSNMSVQSTGAAQEDKDLAAYEQLKLADIYRFPARYKEAYQHREANRMGYKPTTSKLGQPSPLCLCCQLPIQRTQFSMCQNTKPQVRTAQQYKQAQKNKQKTVRFNLKAGVSMYFFFIKICIFYLILVFLSSGAYNAYYSMIATCLPGHKCPTDMAIKTSIFSKKGTNFQQLIYMVDFLYLVSVALSIVFCLICKKYQFMIFNQVDRRNTSIKDYSIFVQNIPRFIQVDINALGKRQFDYQRQIKQAFQLTLKEWVRRVKEAQGQGGQLQAEMFELTKKPNFESLPKVRSICLCYDLSQVKNLRNIREQLMQKCVQSVQSNHNIMDDQTAFRKKYIEPIQILNSQVVSLCDKFANDNALQFQVSHFAGKAFVSFQYQHYKDYLMSDDATMTNVVRMVDNDLKLDQSVQPSDIYWFNMPVSDFQRKSLIFFSYIMVFMILVIVLALLFSLQELQKSFSIKKSAGLQGQQEDNMLGTFAKFYQNGKINFKAIIAYLMSYIMIVITSVIDTLLNKLMPYLTVNQKHQTKSQELTSKILKSILASFFNTAVMYYILYKISQGKIDPVSSQGIVTKVMALVGLGSLLKFIKMNVWDIFKERYWAPPVDSRDPNATQNVFQIQLNQKLEQPEFNFSQRYSFYIANICTVSFFSYICPMALVFLIAIFIVNYWMDKYNLFHRYSCQIDFSFTLSKLTFRIFQFGIFFMAIGNFLFAPVVHQDYKWININTSYITLALATGYLVGMYYLPARWQQKLFYFDQLVLVPFTTCLKKKYFTDCYWRSNPATGRAKQPDINRVGKYIDYGKLPAAADVQRWKKQVQQELDSPDEFEDDDDLQEDQQDDEPNDGFFKSKTLKLIKLNPDVPVKKK